MEFCDSHFRLTFLSTSEEKDVTILVIVCRHYKMPVLNKLFVLRKILIPLVNDIPNEETSLVYCGEISNYYFNTLRLFDAYFLSFRFLASFATFSSVASYFFTPDCPRALHNQAIKST